LTNLPGLSTSLQRAIVETTCLQGKSTGDRISQRHALFQY
jgi:hypothetical protein